MKKLSDAQYHRRMEKAFPFLMLLAAGAVLLSIPLAVSIGQIKVPFLECYKILSHKLFGLGSGSADAAYTVIIEDLRGPRVLMSAVVGAGLSICGVAMQAAIQNPLAEPYILGTSSGASLGATAIIMIGADAFGVLGSLGIRLFAFGGALLSGILVLTIAQIGSRATSAKLVLAGVIVNLVCSTFRDIIIYAFPNEAGLMTVSFWATGSVASAKWSNILILAIPVLVVCLFFFTQVRIMNTLMLGGETAVTLGVNALRYQRIYMALAALLTGVIVAQCGIIGYVGLIIPHFSRSLVGTNHQRLVPFSICVGALFVIWCDVMSRALISGAEIPLGLVTSAIGAPLLLYMVIKSRLSG